MDKIIVQFYLLFALKICPFKKELILTRDELQIKLGKFSAYIVTSTRQADD